VRICARNVREPDTMRTASWVIVRIATGEVLFETFNPAIVAKINTTAYRAVPILEHLQSLNRKG
jgi:hypothetical protein